MTQLTLIHLQQLRQKIKIILVLPETCLQLDEHNFFWTSFQFSLLQKFWTFQDVPGQVNHFIFNHFEEPSFQTAPSFWPPFLSVSHSLTHLNRHFSLGFNSLLQKKLKRMLNQLPYHSLGCLFSLRCFLTCMTLGYLSKEFLLLMGWQECIECQNDLMHCLRS